MCDWVGIFKLASFSDSLALRNDHSQVNHDKKCIHDIYISFLTY
jgi:hypothetical protein